MQILYLSNRPAVMAETLGLVRRLMPWVGQAIVVAPQKNLGEFDLGDDVVLISDEDVTGLTSEALGSMDHVRRNVTLRRCLIEGQELTTHSGATIDDSFLLSDDDYRPLRPISRSFFGDGTKDRSFFFYDLNRWPGNDTPFDEAQHTTRNALSLLGGSQLSFGSHMPQIMRKEYWLECFERFDELTEDPMVCEWTLYFNCSIDAHPEHFFAPEPFQTLCWPQFPGEWPHWVTPPRHAFENHYPDLYNSGGLFDGLDAAPLPGEELRSSFEKLRRWSTFERAGARLQFPDDVENPWTKDSALRRTSFGVLSKARKAYGYLAFEDRTANAHLSGELAALRDELAALRSALPTQSP